VIAFEQQGHGHTADVDRPFSFEAIRRGRRRAAPAPAGREGRLPRYSNGGHIALEIALRHPEVVRSLILQVGLHQPRRYGPALLAGVRSREARRDAARAEEGVPRTAPHPEQLPSFFAKSVQRMREFKGWPPAQVQTIRVPTLLILGDRDIVRVEHAVQMQHLLPDARLAVLPATDHLAMTDRAAAVALMVDEFLLGGSDKRARAEVW